MAGQGVGADAGVRGAAPARGARRDGVRRPRAGRGARAPARARGARAARTATRGRCWAPRSGSRSTSGCSTGSSPRRAATRWRCSSCRERWPRPSWPAGFGTVGAMPCRGGSRRATFAGSTSSVPMRGVCFCWRRPSRSETRCCCGARRSDWASPLDAAESAGDGLLDVGERVTSVIRWCARPSTGRRTGTSAERRIWRWPRRPTADADPDRHAWHLAAAAAGPTRRSPWSWSDRRAGRRRAAAWPRRRRSCSGRWR